MSDLLAEMARASHARVERTLADAPREAWRARALEAPAPPPLRLDARGFDLLCEVKFASPSAGSLVPGSADDAARRARSYAEAGAAAVSVLTEPARFGGSLDHLRAAAAGAAAPVMRKDFLVDPVQVDEARVAGAAGVLLIARMLDDAVLERMLEAAHGLSMFALVEAFDRQDVERTARLVEGCDPARTLVGVNSRDLSTLAVEPGRLEALAPLLPEGFPGVAESGLESEEDAERLATAGYRLALVGTALMRAPDSAALVRDMLAAGRSVRRRAS